ncbi:hypothetical protein WHR41_04625 [Cladosporium halotolerans]|uniref:Uncharacterized protein n=1 Tax=Cladosporium halotolerans TaxID=1052096 RepID=A0AB34KSN5_9PEZI
MQFKVYTIEYLGWRGNHVAIFVVQSSERNVTGSGRLYHVIGSIQEGMKYEARDSKPFGESTSFVQGSQILIGTVEDNRMPDFEAICEATPVPRKQMNLRGRVLDPSKPVRRCRKWVEETVEKLLADGIVK